MNIKGVKKRSILIDDIKKEILTEYDVSEDILIDGQIIGPGSIIAQIRPYPESHHVEENHDPGN